jgi:UDP-N-acetylglucosamine 2-epimerase (non-hydrolysing)/GDP/UDP-N,N'-diacetylbacillosamine 2-epimerase (hydrolysing)
MRSTLKTIQATGNFDLAIVATGMHLSPEFGSTVREIERDGFAIAATVPSLRPEDTGAGMLRSFARFLTNLIDILEDVRPTLLLLLGDRWEMLAGAMGGSYMNIPVAHVHGGEVSGSIDEPNRQAITRFSHIHLVACREHAKVLDEIGEQSSRIHVVGAPGLDDIVLHDYLDPSVVAEKYKIDRSQHLVLLVQHPVVTEWESAGKQIKETLDAIANLRFPTIAIYPNADAGGREMIRVMKRYASRYPFIRLYRNIPREEYLGIMAIANVIVGNSSSGIIEAASFHLPAVDIGIRQSGRMLPANVLRVGYNERQITRAVRTAISREFRRKIRKLKNPYGDGHAAQRISNILSKVRPTARLLQKRLEVT